MSYKLILFIKMILYNKKVFSQLLLENNKNNYLKIWEGLKTFEHLLELYSNRYYKFFTSFYKKDGKKIGKKKSQQISKGKNEW